MDSWRADDHVDSALFFCALADCTVGGKLSPDKKGNDMGMEWMSGWAKKYAATPEKLAEGELRDARLSLFQAERQLLESEMRVDYYRSVLVFLEAIASDGVESVADRQRPQQLALPQRPMVLRQILQEEPADTRRVV